MGTNYEVRVYCEDEGVYKYTTQVDAVEPTWVPEGCEDNKVKDFVIESEETT